MMDYSLKKIDIEGSSHVFVCSGLSNVLTSGKLRSSYVFKRQLYSTLYKKNDYITKVCYGQSVPKDILRKYVFKSQAVREVKSSEILTKLGLLAPISNFRAFSLFPFTKGWIESIHEMVFLDGFEDLGLMFAQRDDSLRVIKCFGRDLALVVDAMYCPKDLGMGNIMYHPTERKIAWIDTDLRKFKSKEELLKSVMSKLRPRFLRYLDSHQTDWFWAVFCETTKMFTYKKEFLEWSGK